MNNQKGVAAYQQMDLQTKVATADPHEVITLLMQGAIDRIEQAKGFIQQKDYSQKSKMINKCVDIVNGLRAALNMKEGGEITEQLDSLYDFMVRHLFIANKENSETKLDEVADLIRTIMSGWKEIPQSVRQEFQSNTEQFVKDSVTE